MRIDGISLVTESAGNMEMLVGLTAFASMLVMALTLLLVAFVFYRVRDDYKKMLDGETRVDALVKREQSSDYISDQVTNVLYDLYSIISSIKSNIELERMGYEVKDALFDKIDVDMASIEKHFLEIGLLSSDKERRISAQRSLANYVGDFDTLEIMNKISQRQIGIFDDEIFDSIKQLQRRISSNVYESSTWSGRPSGGAF